MSPQFPSNHFLFDKKVSMTESILHAVEQPPQGPMRVEDPVSTDWGGAEGEERAAPIPCARAVDRRARLLTAHLQLCGPPPGSQQATD